jgi:hypothetical protein
LFEQHQRSESIFGESAWNFDQANYLLFWEERRKRQREKGEEGEGASIGNNNCGKANMK